MSPAKGRLVRLAKAQGVSEAEIEPISSVSGVLIGREGLSAESVSERGREMALLIGVECSR